MKRKINVKLQKFSHSKKSFILTFSPQEENIKSLRGDFYGIVGINENESDSNLDLDVVKKIAHDVLEGTYYGNLDGPPLPAMEQAVLRTKDRLNLLAEEYSTRLDFSLAACALWGKVLYLTKLGEGDFYLLRGGNIKEILPGAKSDISLASGMVEEGDVVILADGAFAKNFGKESILKNLDNLETLLSGSSQGHSLLILKFDTESYPDEKDLLKISIPKVDMSSQSDLIKQSVSNLFRRIKVKSGTKGPVLDKGLYVSREKTSKVSGTPQSRGLGRLVLVLGFLLILSVVFTINKQRKESAAKVIREAIELTDQNIASSAKLLDLNNAKARDLLTTARKEITDLSDLGIEDQALTDKLSEIDELLDKVNRVRKANSQPYFELSEDAQITTSVFHQGELYLFDKDKGVLHTVSVSGETPVSSSKDTGDENYAAIRSLEEQIILGNQKEVSVLEEGEFNTLFEIESEDSSYTNFDTYFGNVYLLVPERNQIAKYSTAGDSYAKTDWIKKTTDLAGASSIAVDGDIYILKGNSELIRFAEGERDDFSLLNLPEPFSEAVYLYTNPELQFVYILDKGSERVLVVSKDGYYNSQIRLDPSTGPGEWGGLTSVTADVDGGFLYITTKNKVWKVAMGP